MGAIRWMAPVNTLPPLEEVLQLLIDWGSILGGTNTQGSRRVLADLIQEIHPIRVARGQCRAAITWTPLASALLTLAETVVPAA
jgi:hypothetical protein